MEGNLYRQGVDNFSSPGVRERPISPEKILSAVGNEYRLAVLDSLSRASDGILGYDELIERVADRVRDEGTERESDEHRQRIRIALHHTHLPKLEDVRIVDYEAETGQVQFVGGKFEQEILTLIESYATE